MHIENNTEWIGLLANQLSNALESTSVNLNPVNTTPLGRASGEAGAMSKPVSNTTYGGNTDNSVVFNSGAIQLNCQNTSDEEARRLAEKIMYYIKRQTQLENMTSYNT